MKFKSQNRELTLDAFRSSLEDLPKSNRWVKLGDTLPWEKIERSITAVCIMSITERATSRRA
jgi:hypothetical protein